MKTDLSTSTLSLLNFTDAVEFLRAYYESRKSLDKDFSYAVWAQELGLKSRSFLRLLLVGKRSLTEAVGLQLSQFFKFNQTEAKYFSHLVSLSRANELGTKEFHSREISKLRQKFALKNHDLVEVQKADLYDFLSSYQIPRLQVLLGLEDIEKTESHLASLLKIKETEVSTYLMTLQKLGLAKKENNQWIAQESQLMTPDVLGNIALQSFHRKSLEEAIEGINLPKETRRYQSLVMALDPEQFQQMHDELRQHLEDLLKKFSTPGSQNKKVYQLNLNLIPVTGPIFRKKSREPMASPDTKKENDYEKP